MAADRRLARLERALAAERRALLEGQLEALPRLVAERERLLAELPTLAPDRAALAALREEAGRNAALCAAVRDGIAAARARLEEIARGAPLGTYGARGDRQEMGRAPRLLQRRS